MGYGPGEILSVLSLRLQHYKPDDGTGRSKEADSGIRPNPPRLSYDYFPALVIECGNRKSLLRLYQDRDWWFDNSTPEGLLGDVKVVLTVKIDPQTCEFSIEQWRRNHGDNPTQSITILPKDREHLSA